MSKARDALRKLLETGDEVFGIPCTVDSVDTENKTCYCLPIDESKADLIDVRLMADNKTGFLIVPKKGSVVIVSMITNEAGYISMFSDFDLMLLNGDNYGGLIKVDDWLDSYNNQRTALITAILAALTSIDASIVALSGASVSGPAFQSATAAITDVLAAAITNTTVKHGNGS